VSDPIDADPVIAAEQRHMNRALLCLEQMRLSAADPTQAGTDSAAAAALAKLRATRLALLGTGADGAPFFARIDRDPEPDVGRERLGEVFHIGKRHIRDDAGNPVVVDWRAPIARAFYQATPRNRMNIRLRRRFGLHNDAISSYEDEYLAEGETLGTASDLLRQEIERPRAGPMRDIVATIQPDQDDLVRADLDTSLCIQGSPGTGKTAVGLHRAAYLLYTYPDRLRRSGVLVIGPNRAFLQFIAQVLPTLGEGGIEQATITSIVDANHEPVSEDSALAVLKGDARMAGVLQRAIDTHIGAPASDLLVAVGTQRYRISASRLQRFIDQTRASQRRWSVGRERLRRLIAAEVRRQREDAGGSMSDSELGRIARSKSVHAFVDEVWPALKPPQLLARLVGDRELLDKCSKGILSETEVDLLHRSTRSPSTRSMRWSTADLALLDELGWLINGVSTYTHIVVDEAQDLSAMQCRMIGHRCPVGSVTVLGDLAQATTPWAPGSWTATLRHLGRDQAEIRHLTAGYRVPAAVLELANRLLPHISAEVPPATSTRTGQHPLAFAPRHKLVATARSLAAMEGSVGVIVADPEAGQVLADLRAAGLAAGPVGESGNYGFVIVPATLAKGLEYDSVVLLEPAAVIAAEPSRTDGLRRLYVALTRAVSRLIVVHDQPLPEEMV
jgi:DNA helicase IV